MPLGINPLGYSPKSGYGFSGILGDIASGGSASKKGLFGSKPIVPDAPDYLAELKKTIQGDIGLMPDLTTLSTSATALYRQLMEQAHPGTIALEDAAQKDIGSLLAGNLPGMDEYLKRRGAEIQAGSGTSGSSFGFGQEADFAFDKKSQLIAEGLQAQSRWEQQAQSRTFDFSKMLFGPQEAIQQADARFNRDWLANQVAAAPDPAMRGAMDIEGAVGGGIMGFFSGGGGRPNLPTGGKQNWGGGTMTPIERSQAVSESTDYFNQQDMPDAGYLSLFG